MKDAEKQGLDAFFATVAIAPLDEQVKEIAIAFRRATRCKLPDAVIAATAVNNKAELVTNDRKLLSAKFPGFKVRGI